MLFFKIGIIIACVGGLAGLLLIKSRVVKASLMAGLSGIMLLLAAMLKQMVDYQVGLLLTFSNTEHPSPYSPELLSYQTGIINRMTEYGGALQLAFWLLLAFLLMAPFVLIWHKRNRPQLP
jgi:hypothetical protein